MRSPTARRGRSRRSMRSGRTRSSSSQSGRPGAAIRQARRRPQIRSTPGSTGGATHGKVDKASLRCVVSTYIEGVPFFVGTSKMGCASWNLPAGPDVVEVDFGKGLERVHFGGACPSAAGLNLFERIKDLSEAEQE